MQHLTGVGAMPLAGHDADSAHTIAGIVQALAALDETQIARAIHVSVEQRLAHTPTIVVLDNLSRLDQYDTLRQEPGPHMLPRYYRELLWNPAALPLSRWPDGATVRAHVRSVVRGLHEAGGTLHVGSDTLNPFVVPGASLHTELHDFVESGFTPEEAWAAATRENGAALPTPGLGTVAEGAPADLLVFRDDPTRALTALATLEAVVADGRYYSKDALDAAFRRYRDHFDGFIAARVSMLLFRMFGRPMISARSSHEARSDPR